MSNPYVVDGQPPALQQSVFTSLDILGYKEMVLAAEHEGTSDELLSRLHATLARGRELLDPDNPFMRDGDPDLYVLKAFTDNIVIGWPADEDAEIELGSMYGRLAQFQLELATAGFFVRGGLSVGMAYLDEIAVFGGALIEAYRGESETARDPRIVLTESAVNLMEQHLGYYADPEESPQNSELLRDSDGQVFINYLNAVFTDDGPILQRLSEHKSQVMSRLVEFGQAPAVWSKYAWVARYHNAFITQNLLDAALLIPRAEFAADPQVLVQADA